MSGGELRLFLVFSKCTLIVWRAGLPLIWTLNLRVWLCKIGGAYISCMGSTDHQFVFPCCCFHETADNQCSSHFSWEIFFFLLQLDLITLNTGFISSSKLYNDMKSLLFLQCLDFLPLKSEFQICFHPQEGSVQSAGIRGAVLICRTQPKMMLTVSSEFIYINSSDTQETYSVAMLASVSNRFLLNTKKWPNHH